jgi:hypothetical protein
MSPAPQTSRSPDSIDTLLRQANAEIVTNGADDRTRAQAIEANQRMMEYMDDLADDLPPLDKSVTVRCNGVTMRFADTDKMAAWLSGWKDW